MATIFALSRQAAQLLHGGLADRKRPNDLDPDSLAAGIEVEMEHTNDRDVAREIAMDHLTEDPAYYRKLARMEKSEQLDLPGFTTVREHMRRGRPVERHRRKVKHMQDPGVAAEEGHRRAFRELQEQAKRALGRKLEAPSSLSDLQRKSQETFDRGQFEEYLATKKHARDVAMGLMKEMVADGIIEFKKWGTKQHAIVVPDASEPGKWRASYYDSLSFSGHDTFATQDEVLVDLVAYDYTEPAPGSLDRLSQTDEWAHGMAVVQINKYVGTLQFAAQSATAEDAKRLRAAAKAIDDHRYRHEDSRITEEIVTREWKRLMAGDVPEALLKAIALGIYEPRTLVRLTPRTNALQ